MLGLDTMVETRQKARKEMGASKDKTKGSRGAGAT